MICINFGKWVHSMGVNTHVYFEDPASLIFDHMAKNVFLVYLWRKNTKMDRIMNYTTFSMFLVSINMILVLFQWFEVKFWP